jgi:hypothetical protein
MMTADVDTAQNPDPPVVDAFAEQESAVPKEWVEHAARLAGWDPNHKGYNGSAGLSAEDFLKSVPVRTKRTTDKLFKLESTVESIAQNFEAQKQRAYERGKAELQAQLAAAIEEGNGKAAVDITNKISHLDKQQVTQVATRPPPEAEAWLAENPWFNQDRQLNRVAQAIEADLMDQGVSDLRTRLERVSHEVRQRYPEKFGGTRDRNAAPRTVEAPANGGAAPRQDGNAVRWQTLGDDMKNVFRQLHRGGAWPGKSEEEARAAWLKDMPSTRRR